MNQYTVQKGDTIAHVTKRLQTDWQTLRKQNPNGIGRSKANGNWFVREGANISVGKGSFADILSSTTKEISPPTPSTPPPTAKQPDELIEYTVQPGDTLWALAVKQFRVNPGDLIRDNGLENPDLLQIGQKLQLMAQVVVTG